MKSQSHVVISSDPCLLCFQPILNTQLFISDIQQFILVSAEPFSRRPTTELDTGPETPRFIMNMVKFYTRNGFQLVHTTRCLPIYPTKFMHIGMCCGMRKPSCQYAKFPYVFEFIRGTQVVKHYVSSDWPNHISHEFVQDVQRATMLLVTRRWVPPPALFDMFESIVPLKLYIDKSIPLHKLTSYLPHDFIFVTL